MTSTLSEHECLELWYKARDRRIGIVVETSDPERFRQRMYQVRRAAADETLEGLMLIISPTAPASEVWIARRMIEDSNAQG